MIDYFVNKFKSTPCTEKISTQTTAPIVTKKKRVSKRSLGANIAHTIKCRRNKCALAQAKDATEARCQTTPARENNEPLLSVRELAPAAAMMSPNVSALTVFRNTKTAPRVISSAPPPKNARQRRDS